MPDSSVAMAATKVASPKLVEEDDDIIDDEILEVFIEEAGEVSETLDEHFPVWKNDFQNQDALTVVRRAFHTLKGSGRMVKANDIGEMAWAVENMLNRVIDKTVPASVHHAHLIERVLAILPSMIEAFANRQGNPKPEETQQYMAWGDALAAGELPEALALAEGEAPQAAAAPEPAPVESVPEVAQLHEASKPAIETPAPAKPEASEPKEPVPAPKVAEVAKAKPQTNVEQMPKPSEAPRPKVAAAKVESKPKPVPTATEKPTATDKPTATEKPKAAEKPAVAAKPAAAEARKPAKPKLKPVPTTAPRPESKTSAIPERPSPDKVAKANIKKPRPQQSASPAASESKPAADSSRWSMIWAVVLLVAMVAIFGLILF